jgi:hypothetical protein
LEVFRKSTIWSHNILYYKRYASPAERLLAGRLKQLCDPKGLLGAVDFS